MLSKLIYYCGLFVGLLMAGMVTHEGATDRTLCFFWTGIGLGVLGMLAERMERQEGTAENGDTQTRQQVVTPAK